MDQILNKLSEIEITANYIMEEAAQRKQQLSLEMEEKCREFDEMVNEATAKKVEEIRRQLEKDKETELTRLRQKTEAAFARMDVYYNENHARLAKEIFDKILNG